MVKRVCVAMAVVMLCAAPLAMAATTAKPAAGAAKTADAAKSTAKSTASTAEKGTSAKAAAMKVDINTASSDELAKLPVIGDAIAAKIVAGRPYKTKRDLLTKKILTTKQYAKISGSIIAKQ
ncbi:MAG: helix-hairpin-helix domain-containing protein [Candidatus Eisenbacteria bacterium]|nr:helix-hairpin-helix domain-containing protein [Candidatus Eisenbacteria bacterium]